MAEPGSRRPLSRGEWISIALATTILGGAVYLWQRSAAPPPAPPANRVEAHAEAGAEAPPTGPGPAVDEATARALLEGVSPAPSLRRWLGLGDAYQRWAVVTDNLAEGVSPRKQLELFAPKGPFAVVERAGRTLIAPASYGRYDGFVDAVASVDPQAFARAYRALHPAVEAAYRALGYPGASLDRATALALSRIERAPARDGEVEVVGDRGLYLFADPELERLGEVEKHLLRMGPNNTRVLQGKARELREALALPPDVARQQP